MTFEALDRELDRWAQREQVASLWWRDDDASRATPALTRMLGIAARHGVPVAIAVIPGLLTTDLCDLLNGTPACSVLQHGFEHRNHAAAGERSAEFGAQRSLPTALSELALGRQFLQQAFGARFLPVLVPPWNRIGPAVVAELAGQGYRGLSTFAPRPRAWIAPGLAQCNTHVDPIAWRRGRTFIGATAAALSVAAHLALRREGKADPTEPTGLLSHHLDFNDEAWQFVERLFEHTTRHPSVAWLSAEAAFGLEKGVSKNRVHSRK